MGNPGVSPRRIEVSFWFQLSAMVLFFLTLIAAVWIGRLWREQELHPWSSPFSRGRMSSTLRFSPTAHAYAPREQPRIFSAIRERFAPLVRPTSTMGSRLSLYNLHTKESLSAIPFDGSGAPYARGLDAIRRFMRCRFSGNEMPIETRLVRLLVRISEAVDGRTIQLVSGYRSPGANGTSETSYHTRGMAADIRIVGVSSDHLRALADSLGAGGVGLYHTHRFVHVDVREKRYRWEE